MSSPHALSPAVRAAYLDNAVRETEFWRAAGITLPALESAAEASPDVQRYQVIGGRVFRAPRQGSRRAEWFEQQASAFEAALRALLAGERGSFPNVDFVVNLGDYPIDGVPVMSTWVQDEVRNPRLPSSVLWPAQSAASGDAHAVRGCAVFEDDALEKPFLQRESKVVWRGTATGIYDSHVDRFRRMQRIGLPWGRESSRIALLRHARRAPHLLDAAFTGIAQVNERNARFLSQRFPVRAWVPQSWFLRHRYIVNVDGNVATSSFLAFLGSGSAVIRQASPYREFCTRQVERHGVAIPSRRDLSDLPDIAEWALNHPLEGERVATKARSFAKTWLNGDAVDSYMRSLFSQYALALSEPVTLARGAEPV